MKIIIMVVLILIMFHEYIEARNESELSKSSK